jgi:MATE family multidrug resistance protein
MSLSGEVTVRDAARRLPGSIPEVAVLAYPIVLQTLSDTMMQVVDTAIVGRLGVTELGAVGFGGIWLWTVLVIFVGSATGVQTFVAQDFGAGRAQSCGGWVWQGMYALVPASLVWFGLIAVGFKPLLALLGPSVQLQGFAAQYAHARLCGAPAVVAGVIVTSFFRGRGDTRTPLLATIIANVLNAAAAYGLVFGRFGLPAWGVAGAGAATAFANWTYAAMLFTLLLRRPLADAFGTWPVGPDWGAVGRFLRTSVPIGGQWVLDMVSFALFSSIIARMGDVPIAASQVMIQLLALSFMQAFGISIAAGALVGRYIGAAELAAAERSHRSALQLGLGLAAGIAVLFLTAPEFLLRLFTSDAGIIGLGRPLLMLAAVFQAIDAVGIIVGGSLRGAGDTRWPFLVQTAFAWCVRLPLVYLLAVQLHGGLFGAWLGELSYVAVLGATWLLRFRGGAWRAMRI